MVGVWVVGVDCIVSSFFVNDFSFSVKVEFFKDFFNYVSGNVFFFVFNMFEINDFYWFFVEVLFVVVVFF